MCRKELHLARKAMTPMAVGVDVGEVSDGGIELGGTKKKME